MIDIAGFETFQKEKISFFAQTVYGFPQLFAVTYFPDPGRGSFGTGFQHPRPGYFGCEIIYFAIIENRSKFRNTYALVHSALSHRKLITEIPVRSLTHARSEERRVGNECSRTLAAS